MKSLVKELCSASFVSGCEISDEDNVILGYLKKHEIPYEIDSIGNIIFQRTGNGEKILMLIAHYDEVGFSVKQIDENGYVYFSPIGGMDISILRGQKVMIKHDGQNVSGVIGVRPIHMMNNERSKNNLDVSDLWIDVGIIDKKEIDGHVSVGDYISFPANYSDLTNGLFSSKSIDNRVGVAALLSVYEKIKNSTNNDFKSIYFVLSSQEELGLRGARVAGYTINPDICIAVDVTHATDYPTVNKHKFGDIKINQGAVIPVGSNFNASLQKKLRNIATEHGISYQIESLPSYSGTDISEIQISRNGCVSGLICIPCRYMHTPIEIASYHDLQSLVDILSIYAANNT